MHKAIIENFQQIFQEFIFNLLVSAAPLILSNYEQYQFNYDSH